ncbi:MAG: diacylglycerol kinase family protein [Saprospiraceae bacterium]|nr:diacylglycerol kinase family protein [Saprospiraceae bacterium]
MKFSIKKFFSSVKYAFSGLVQALHSEQNTRIHLLASALVIVASWYFELSKIEWCIVIFCIGLVWSAEIFNTAIEKLSDVVSQDYHPKIKVVKDLSAAAVFIASLTTLMVGSIIFYQKIF